jgi:peptidyl-prolyl cis-trans isomerase B (cyclophilin B)
VFGKVVKGMNVVDKVRKMKTGAKGPFRKNAPVTDVVIKKSKVL